MLYLLLFKGGFPTSELTSEYLEKFAYWAKSVASDKIPMNRLKQEGKVVSIEGVQDLKFDKDIVGGYIAIEASNYDCVIEISKGCPILENNGKVEIRPIVLSLEDSTLTL